MMLLAAIDSFLAAKRALGAGMQTEGRILRAFARAAGDVPLPMITRDVCTAFCRGPGPPRNYWRKKHHVLSALFEFAVSRGQLASTPLPDKPPPAVTTAFEPHIYSRDELKRLLDATAMLHYPNSPLQKQTFRTLLLTIYGAGLRPGEGLRLRCCDIDLRERILSVWDTKFFKSRLVPVGDDLCRALGKYRRARRKLPMPEGRRSALFATRTGYAVSVGWLEKIFSRLRKLAHVQSTPGRPQPRLHDLRHTFAVHRLVAWYREGADVQACLPILSTYLGHVDLSGTQTYLSMTSELLAAASQRFEHYAKPGQGGAP